MPAQAAYLPSQDLVVKFGAIAPRVPRRCLPLARYCDLAQLNYPSSFDLYTKAQKSLSQMLDNNRYGNCVPVGEAHLMGTRSANDGHESMPTVQEVDKFYFDYTGGRDEGCIISEVLDLLTTKGMAGHKLAGWLGFNPADRAAVQAAIWLMGGCTFGIAVTNDMMNTARPGGIWKDQRGGILGYHEVVGVGYDATGVQVATWGVVVTATWELLRNSRIWNEAYASIGEDWLGPDRLAPNGTNFDQLKDDMQKLKEGNVPPMPGPVVPPPPPPPGSGLWISVESAIPAGRYHLHDHDQETPAMPQEQSTSERAGGFFDQVDFLSLGVCLATCALGQLPQAKLPGKQKAIPKPEWHDKVDWTEAARALCNHLAAQGQRRGFKFTQEGPNPLRASHPVADQEQGEEGSGEGGDTPPAGKRPGK